MNLRYIVPALGILITSSGALFAENVGGLTVGGFVDTTLTIADTKDDHLAVDKTFASSVELRLGYKVGEKVTAQVDMEWNNDSANDTNLEQAYVNWAMTNTVSLTTGKFTSYSGWTAADADGLYRINSGPIVKLYTADVIGAAVNFAPMADLGVSVFALNGLGLGTGAEENNDANNTLQALAVDAVYTLKDVGTFNLEFGYDVPQKDKTAFSFGLNTTLKLASYQPLTVGAEFMIDSFSDETGASTVDGSAIGFLVMGNHTLPTSTIMPFPSSVTGMITIMSADAESGLDLGVGNTADSSLTELAVALLTNPTNDSHFGVNAELAYQIASSDAANSEDEKSISFALEAIAVIP